MPELPEVETLRRSLLHLKGRCFRSVDVYSAHCLYEMDPSSFRDDLIGRCIEDFDRRGKYLHIIVNDGAVLTVHLRMTGRLLHISQAEELERPVRPGESLDYEDTGRQIPAKHVHLRLGLDDGSALIFHDVRKFGRIYLHTPPPGLAKLGPEPLSANFTPQYLLEGVAQRKAPIKNWLLDQRRVAGLGNIYVDESLFRAGIHPERPAGSLLEREVDALYRSIRDVLHAAIEACGTTFSDFQDGYGRPGNFGQELYVYQRAGQRCRRCHETIRTCKVGGRTSHYCPQCQR